MTAISTASWRSILEELRRSDAGLLRAWLYDLDAPILASGILTIRARNRAQQIHLENHSSLLGQCAQTALGRLVSVQVELSEAMEEAADQRDSEAGRVRGDYRLDRFVVSPENQLAHAAGIRVLEPGAPFNPLFFHGASGSGKSHLLMGLCREVSSAGIHAGGALYRTAREFVADFTHSFDAGLSSEFRSRYVQASLVAMDDVQDFAGKSRSQEELFHILNARLSSGRPLVLAADRPPTTIRGLSDRLVSRFAAGLVLVMDDPGEETRLRILRQKNADASYGIPEEALEAVARRCTPRDLKDVLSRINAMAASQDSAVSMDLVEAVLRGRLSEVVIA